MRVCVLLLPLLASGCLDEETTLYWLEGFGFGWTGFNHRVSYMHFDVDEGGLDFAVIGGASSTSYVPDLPTGCDEETCSELPFEDSTTVDLAWGTTTSNLPAGSATATVIATPEGGETTVEIPLSSKGKGQAVALLQSFALDTDYALTGGDACYIPSLGWHPRRIALDLADPTLSSDGRSVLLTLTAAFEAGLSFEEYRSCQDEVIGEEQVAIDVRILGLVARDGSDTQDLDQAMSYEFSGNQFDPEEQPDPDLEDRPLTLDIDPAIVGWSALDFRFHEQDETLRGAYLRTLSVGLDTDEGWASGHASNYSPGTQLSDFTYTFAGTVAAVQTDSSVVHGRASYDEVEAALDDDNRPEVQHEDL